MPARLHAAAIISFAIVNLRKQDGRKVSFPGLVRDNPCDGPIGIIDPQLRLQREGRGIPAWCEKRSDGVLPCRNITSDVIHLIGNVLAEVHPTGCKNLITDWP